MSLLNWLYTIPLRTRALFQRSRVEQDLEDEFQFHLAQRTEANIAHGMSLNDARLEALSALDRISLRKEECRDMRGLNFIENLLQDLRYAVRVLRKSPVFTAVAVLSLALGIGANTAIFSVMDVLLLRPIPVMQPSGLRLITLSRKTGPRVSFNYPMFELVRDRNRVFTQTFAWTTVNFQTPQANDMLLIPGALASGDYFAGLGVPPQLGRVYGREDDQALGGKNGPVGVISDGLWTRRYGRSPSVIGQAIILNAVPITIIGVMPRGFFGAEVGTAPDIWVPLNLQRQLMDSRCIGSSDCWYLITMGRLNPGLSVEQAAAQLQSISRGVMEDSHPPTRADRKAAFLAQVIQTESGEAGFTGLRRRIRGPLEVLMGLVGFVLLIACANMANLLTARASARQKEVAVRLAMGASRPRVIRQFLTESVLLSIVGAAVGFLIAIGATRVLIALLSTTDTPVVLDLNPDWRILLFTAAAAMGTGLLFGLAPSIRATRAGLGAALKERAHQIQGSARAASFGFTRLLLALQVALSIVLLAAAGLLAGSLVRLLTESPGFDPHNITVVSVDTSKLREKGPALIELYGRMIERARTFPGVESASLMSTTPLTNSGWDNTITIPGRTDISEEERDTNINAVAPRLLETMKVPLLAGRDFTDADTAESGKVAILSETAARKWFPNGAVGADMGLQGSTVRIVGIMRDTKYLNLRDRMQPTLYVPFTQWSQGGFIAIRTAAPLRQTYAMFREMLREVAPGAPIRTIRTMEQQVDESLSTERLTAYLSLFFAALALMLTAIGLYGILAYSVTRRTNEIGVRMALGAQRSDVIWLVIRQAMGQTAFGAAAGIAVVIASSRLIASLLYGVRPNDPAMMIAAVAALALVCAGAAWIPARRATRLDPVVALREE
ncbi:MAG TPA: ABC transporter permease [Bryobacteraceae bacterium]|jgi:predicted permease